MTQILFIALVLYLVYSLVRSLVKSFKTGLVYISPKSYSKERSTYTYWSVQIGKVIAFIVVILLFVYSYPLLF
jgi:hypothetical protein